MTGNEINNVMKNYQFTFLPNKLSNAKVKCQKLLSCLKKEKRGGFVCKDDYQMLFANISIWSTNTVIKSAEKNPSGEKKHLL